MKPWRGVSYITNITVADWEIMTLWWRHNERIVISNHQRLHCFLKCSFTHRSKKTSQLCVTGLCEGNSLWPVNSPHNGPVTRKMFPFDDVIMTMQRTRALGLGGTAVMELTYSFKRNCVALTKLMQLVDKLSPEPNGRWQMADAKYCCYFHWTCFDNHIYPHDIIYITGNRGAVFDHTQE